MAAVEAFTSAIAPNLPTLFEPNADEVQKQIGQLAGGDRFSKFARDFFSRLTQRTLGYFLSRELGNHVGQGKRFRDDIGRAHFDEALNRHCSEASRIVEAFAGGWYGKNVYQGEGITHDTVRRFAPIAFKKIRAELRKRRDVA